MGSGGEGGAFHESEKGQGVEWGGDGLVREKFLDGVAGGEGLLY